LQLLRFIHILFSYVFLERKTTKKSRRGSKKERRERTKEERTRRKNEISQKTKLCHHKKGWWRRWWGIKGTCVAFWEICTV